MTPSSRPRSNALFLLLLSLAVSAIVSIASPALAVDPPAAPAAPAESAAAPSACTVDADCKSEGRVCESGTCVYKLTNPLGDTSIPKLVGRVVTIFTGISGSFALLMFIYGGVLWIFSGGSEERVTKGKEVMKWAVIGLFIMFSAYMLVNVIFKGFGI